ncbi:MAG: beta-ketoacyl synthase N-terminal-like domain-containing protein [Polyangiaceae bacterium]
MKPLAITGAGVVSTLGVGRAELVEALRSGARAPGRIGRAETFDASTYPRVRIAEVPGFDAAKYLGDKGLRSLDRLTKLLVVATRLALQDAGLKKDGGWTAGSPDRVGMVVSNSYGSLEAITELDRVATLEDARYINPSRFPLTVSNSAAGYASIWEDLRALNVTVSDGGAGALDAVACANLFLEQERADALLVGGFEAMCEALAFAFDRLGAVSETSCLGEGAAILAVEPLDVARARDARVLATVCGFGTAFLPPRRETTLIHASSEAVSRAIASALVDANVAAGEIDLVVSSVSGLRTFDDAEMLAIGRVLGEKACVVAPKLALGETLGASGAMGMLAATAWLGKAASDCRDTPVLRGALRAEARTALVTSTGYYGNASALVMRHPSG